MKLPIYQAKPEAAQPAEEIELKGLPRKYCITDCLIERVLDEGYSAIYKGFERETSAEIIVKKCLNGDEFHRQVAAVARISLNWKMDYIVPILDDFPNRHYIVMPYMNREDVWKLRHAKRGLSPKEMLAIISQAGQALEQVHAAGLVHNDIKSSNILLTAPDLPSANSSERSNHGPQPETLTAMLSDFGLSCSREGVEIPDLEPIHNCGTPAYMAPEALSNDPQVSRPTILMDIYSLALVMYEVLTDTLLYDDNPHTREEVARRIWFQHIPPHEKIPGPVLPVLQRGAELDPAKRYQSIPEMISALEKAVRGE